ncbi:MAG: 16S rRNA (cytosine(967)-C(5))-methyltransferase RsmB [Desulfobacteraceae bacterium]|nr:16S rRNA (cytosine(967)-C(5))-methyltransferase RsmB [Desulfobacteraceae bacterium]
MVNPRILAYQILLHIEQKASHPDRMIRTVLERHSGLEERDRALMTELVYGIVRWQGRLDWHIDALSRTKPDKIAPSVRILLRMGLYQVFFLDRVPAHAAVNETVNIAKTCQPPHLIRFINGLLREAVRRGSNWNRPDPLKDPALHISVTTAHPLWLVQKCIAQMGVEETLAFCEANNRVAPAVLRVNFMKTDPERVAASLHAEAIETEPSPLLPLALRAHAPRKDITRTEAFRNGEIQTQDEASQLVAHILSPQPGERVLDLCAGFGVKSSHIAMLMGNEGEVLSVDKSAWKLEELSLNSERQSLGIIRTLAGDILQLRPETIGLFDRVLLDAPCTGFGTIRRNPDIKWRRHIKDPYRVSQLQKELLAHSASFLKNGGTLVYATCSILRDEDESVAQHLNELDSELVVEDVADRLPENCRTMVSGPYFRSWPQHHGIDGFFAARWKKVQGPLPQL